MPQRLHYPLAVLAGVSLALAFPKFEISGFAWIAPGLMLAAAFGTSGRQTFRIGFTAGLAFWLMSLSWLLNIPEKWFPILGWVALAAYCALFQAVWVWLCWKCFPTSNGRAGSLLPAAEPDTKERRAKDCAPHLLAFSSSSRLARVRWAILCAALWVALEMIRCRLLSGFPWNLLGSSQFKMTPLLQISSVTGVFGVSFLIVWTSVTLLCAGIILCSRKREVTDQLGTPQPIRPPRYLGGYETLLPLLVVAIVFANGYHGITHTAESERSLRVTSIQPSIPQTNIWNPAENDRRFSELMALSERALTNRTDVLIWPEAALPELNEVSFLAITNLAARHGVWFIFGADDVILRPGATNENDVLVYNGAWMLSPRGLIADNYHKRRLVIFGEYVPLAGVLPFVKWLTPITGSFSAGTNAAHFHMRDMDIVAAPLICFEDCFPQARDHVTDATDLLVNLTNDGWFGEGAEQWQHAANAVFRAIENGVPLVRSCNNGLTCWIDPQGRIREAFHDAQGTIHGPGFATFNVPLPAQPRAATFYNRHGDVFGWSCVFIASLAVARHIIRRRR